MKAEDYLQLPDVTYHPVTVTLDTKAERHIRNWRENGAGTSGG